MKTNKITITGSALLLLGSLSSAQASQPDINDACWQNSYTDDFNELDLWNPDTNEGQWKASYIWGPDIIINNELQYYIDPLVFKTSPFSIEDGVLHITAQRTPKSMLAHTQNKEFISGVLTTEKGFSQQYGRFEARLKLPKGQGLWSAFWLLPSFKQWPEGVAVLPEIDVMENLGHEPHTYHTTLHTNQTGELTSHPYDHTLKSDLSEDFHTYSVIWKEDEVNWYLDGQWQASHPTPSDFTKPVHFLLNLAVGGNWPGSPDNATEFPASYLVDYVKAYTEKPNCQ